MKFIIDCKRAYAHRIPRSQYLCFKILIRMKLLALSLMLFVVQAVATVKSQTLSLEFREASLVQVLAEIKKQSGYSFIANTRLLQSAKPVTVALQEANLSETLQAVFKDQALFAELKDGMIHVKAKTEREALAQPAMQQPITLRGTVVDSTGRGLAGVTIYEESGRQSVSDGNGRFLLRQLQIGATLRFQLLGHVSETVAVRDSVMTVRMHRSVSELEEVAVSYISTGVQALPKERATGAFSQVDNELLNRTVSTGIMDRIADVVPGLIFNKGNRGAAALVIRGQTSINTETRRPLIVVDNFPYEGDIDNINPNDVENITILKDAAAASIWGARAGNGVIVITTKQGKFNQKPQLSFNSNYTAGERPDLFYQPKVSTSDFIDNEIRLFDLNVYRPAEINQSLLRDPLTPVVELLIQKRDNPALAAEIDATIDSWRTYDVRNDIEKYFYRPLSRQQYALQLQGGNTQNRYLVSIGYDKNRDSEVGNGLGRLTLNTNHTYAFIKDKLELQTNIYYTDSQTDNNFTFPIYHTHRGSQGQFIYPYARFSDDNGNPLATVGTYRQPFVEDMEAQGFLDWQYRPLDEIRNADNGVFGKEYRLNTALSYTIIPGLKAQVRYQYSNDNNLLRNHYSTDTYFTRNLVNYFSTLNSGTGTVNRAVPVGGILDTDRRTVNSHYFRTQVNYDKVFENVHELNALAGYEISDQKTHAQRTRLYGYDDKYVTSQPVNYNTPYSISIYPSTSYQFRIPNVDRIQELTSRFVSYFGNFGYRYDKRYLLSGSVRFDQSNIFGVRTNQRGVPLYSIGGGWQLNEEDFFTVDWMNELKLRATWGTSGNVNRSLTSLTTINYFSGVDPLTGFQYANVGLAPNPDLRWEKINSLNFGLDFGAINNRINGSIDWYKKWGYDIFSTIPYASQTGIDRFTGNYSDTEARGIDLILQTRNLIGRFQWTSDMQLSYVSDKITKAKWISTTNGFTLLSNSSGTSIVPYEGKPLYAVYGYKWAGLDPENGDPMGFLNGEISKDWQAIYQDILSNPENLAFYGTARPKYFGAIQNTFSYHNISVSTNISYRFDYFFRRPTVNFTNLNYGTWEHADASNVWQVTGDETRTSIPSVPEITAAGFRSGFHTLSENLIEKGDHIRLNDVTFSYTLSKSQFKSMPFQQLRFYGLANNLGILWKATNSTEDPDYYTSMFVPVRSYSFGISANF